MKHYRATVGLVWALLVLLLIPGCPLFATARDVPQRPVATRPIPSIETEPLVRQGFDHFYSLEYDKAIRSFETAVKKYPDDPFPVNYLLSAVIFKELYRIGALDSEMYAGNSFADKPPLKPVDPAVKTRIYELIDQATDLAEARLKENPNDIDALYARGATRSMRSTWMGMGEKAWFAAVRAGVGARKDHERVLQLDPTYADAKTSVGVHNYIVGSMNWAAKLGASFIGIGGSKEKGLQYLREAAASNGLASMDAKIALALFLRREEKYKEALEVVRKLTHDYPRNFLVANEYAYLLNASGDGPNAVVAFRRVLTNYRAGRYAVARPELAAFGLAEALRGQRRFNEAVQAYASVGGFNEVEPELVQRAELRAGEMYDVLNNREAALTMYRSVIEGDGNTSAAKIAKKRLKQPYKENSKD
jgi:tetratricopeptide (TPR) repeat protein